MRIFIYIHKHVHIHTYILHSVCICMHISIYLHIDVKEQKFDQKLEIIRKNSNRYKVELRTLHYGMLVISIESVKIF